MIRRSVLFGIGLALATGACATSRQAATSTTASSNTSRSTLSGGTTPAVTAPGGGGVLLSGSAPNPSAVAAPSEPGSPAVAARHGFDAWLGAVVRDDAATMLAHATGAAAGLGALELVADHLIAGGGGTTANHVTDEALVADAVGVGGVTFSGTVDLQHVITGPKGSTTTTDHITGPVQLVHRAGMWQVVSFTYDGTSMVYYPEGAQTTVDDVHVNVAFLLSTATATTAVVSVYADTPNVTVTLQSAVLTRESGVKQNGRALFAHGPTGMLVFARTRDRPTHLDVSLQKRTGSTTSVSPPIQFSIVLNGQPS